MLRTGWLVVRLMILVSPSDQRGRVRSGAQRQMAVRSFSSIVTLADPGEPRPRARVRPGPVSYTHLTLPTTPYV